MSGRVLAKDCFMHFNLFACAKMAIASIEKAAHNLRGGLQNLVIGVDLSGGRQSARRPWRDCTNQRCRCLSDGYSQKIQRAQ